MADTYIEQLIDDDAYSVYGDRWIAQTFTPASDFRISKFRVKCRRPVDVCGSLLFAFFNVDANGPPDGDAITNWHTIDNDLIPEAAAFVESNVIPRMVFEAGVKYAVVIRNELPTSINRFNCFNSISGGLVNGDMLTSFDSSHTWEDTDSDITFQITGNTPEPPAPHNPTPLDNATVIPIGVKLQWINGSWTDTVDVYLDKISEVIPTTKVVDNQAVTSFQPPDDLDLDEEYIWKVVCKNSYGETEGEVWSFTTGSPIYIYDVDDLQAMNDNRSAVYILANDIDASATSEWNEGAGFDPIGNLDGYFTGALYGNGYVIDGLTVNRSATSYVGGLFGIIGSAGYAEKVYLTNVSVSGKGYVGGFAGYNIGIISTCFADGSVTGNAGHYIGGFVGYASGASGYIWRCWCGVNVTGSAVKQYFGGFTGFHSNGTIKDCYATGSVSAANINYHGGFAADQGASAIIEDCYSKGAVAGSGGGFIKAKSGTITNCFWDKETSGQDSSAGGTGKTTVQMKKEITFTDWDFDTLWKITEDVTYPSFYPRKAINPNPVDDGSARNDVVAFAWEY